MSIGLSQMTKLKRNGGSVTSTKAEVWKEVEESCGLFFKKGDDTFLMTPLLAFVVEPCDMLF